MKESIVKQHQHFNSCVPPALQMMQIDRCKFVRKKVGDMRHLAKDTPQMRHAVGGKQPSSHNVRGGSKMEQFSHVRSCSFTSTNPQKERRRI